MPKIETLQLFLICVLFMLAAGYLILVIFESRYINYRKIVILKAVLSTKLIKEGGKEKPAAFHEITDRTKELLVTSLAGLLMIIILTFIEENNYLSSESTLDFVITLYIALMKALTSISGVSLILEYIKPYRNKKCL